LKAGACGLALESVASELRADLDLQRLAVRKRDLEVEPWEPDRVRPERAKTDGHPLVLGVPACVIGKERLVERCTELAIDCVERVAYERLCDARGVGVRGLETSGVLDEIEPEQECVVVGEHAGEGCEESRAPRGIEVADRAAEQRDQTMAGIVQDVEIAFEVADERGDDDVWIFGCDRL